MKGWIITGIILIVTICIVALSIFYQSIRSPLTDEEERAVQYVLENTEVTEVHDVSFYHGSESYQVLIGTDSDGDEWIVWYSYNEEVEDNDEKDIEDKDIDKDAEDHVKDKEQVIMRKKDDGITFEQVQTFVQNELDPANINNILLGVENQLPVYEISYIDKEDRQAYYYITFKDGTFVKRYSLKRD